MKLSTRARYGVRMMLELALNYGKGPTYLREVAEKEDISEKYLSQLALALKSANLISSERGMKGGYVLKRSPEEINLREIVEALEGKLNLVPCLNNPAVCNRVSLCVTREVWKKVDQAVIVTLEKITLGDLVRSYYEKQDLSYVI
jgi:Rrf2 family protein